MVFDIEGMKYIMETAEKKGQAEQLSTTLSASLEQREQELRMAGEQLRRKDEQLRQQGEQLRQQDDELRQLRQELARLQAYTHGLELTVAGMQAAVASGDAQQAQQVVYKCYLVLSMQRTSDYVRQLDDEHRVFTHHFLNNTLAEGTPRDAYDAVTRLTQLGDKQQTQQLEQQLEHLAEHPTTVNDNRQVTITGDYARYEEHPNDQDDD